MRITKQDCQCGPLNGQARHTVDRFLRLSETKRYVSLAMFMFSFFFIEPVSQINPSVEV